MSSKNSKQMHTLSFRTRKHKEDVCFKINNSIYQLLQTNWEFVPHQGSKHGTNDRRWYLYMRHRRHRQGQFRTWKSYSSWVVGGRGSFRDDNSLNADLSNITVPKPTHGYSQVFIRKVYGVTTKQFQRWIHLGLEPDYKEGGPRYYLSTVSHFIAGTKHRLGGGNEWEELVQDEPEWHDDVMKPTGGRVIETKEAPSLYDPDAPPAVGPDVFTPVEATVERPTGTPWHDDGVPRGFIDAKKRIEKALKDAYRRGVEDGKRLLLKEIRGIELYP